MRTSSRPRAILSAGLAAAVVVAVGAGCSNASSPSGSSAQSTGATTTGSGSHYTFVAVTQGPLTVPIWADYNAGIQAASRALGVTTRYSGTPTSGVVAQQLLQLLTAGAASKPAGMIVTDDIPQSENTELKKITSSGIPIVLFAAGSGQQAATGALSFVGKDYIQAAEAAGSEFNTLGCKDILNVQLLPGASQQSDETTEGLEEAYKGTVTPTNIPLADDTATSQVANIINADLVKDTSVDCVFSGGTNFNAAVTAGESNLGSRTVTLEAHTGTDVAVAPGDFQNIAKGVMAFGINEQPYMAGYMAVVQLYAHVAWDATPSSEVAIGNELVTRSNATTYLDLYNKNKFF
jgi:simple sugar transport system substrate-binding protein